MWMSELTRKTATADSRIGSHSADSGVTGTSSRGSFRETLGGDHTPRAALRLGNSQVVIRGSLLRPFQGLATSASPREAARNDLGGSGGRPVLAIRSRP